MTALITRSSALKENLSKDYGGPVKKSEKSINE